ncbi:MAG: hypothetical protein HY904_11645 [Deltaproteobacteria bacterium]|nr:hypothetical protein [Deltaproteobacteria bacterium]
MTAVVRGPSRAGAVAALVLAGRLVAHAQENVDGGPGDGGIPPLTPEQQAFVERLIEQRLQQYQADQAAMAPPAPPPPSLTMRADVYNKILIQNDQTNGAVTWGTPNPNGDNFSGNNGMASELSLTFNGRVGDAVEAGARVASRYGAQWADFYENGDRRIDPVSGNFGRIDASGQSLGMDHAMYLQLRGVYVRAAPPIPTVRYVHFGSSDLGSYNAWTVGRQRYIDRDNARGIFVEGGYKRWISYHFARVALPKLYASAGWNTGIQDPLVANPFWARDAAYIAKFATEPYPGIQLENVNSFILDEEADRNDPDALGSANLIDPRDGVVQTIPRYTNLNSTVSGRYEWEWIKLTGLAGVSRSEPNRKLASNNVEGSQGFSNIPYKVAYGWALTGRAELLDPFGLNTFLRVEYFNIGPDWVATMGARREADVLLTDGFMEGGQVPTLNIANEFMDFVDPFYESIVGWHGLTLQGEWSPGTSQVIGELTALTYNTNTCIPGFNDTATPDSLDNAGLRQVFAPAELVPTSVGTVWQRDMCKNGRDTRQVYPDFLYNQGMTDTDFYTFANTTDRGRDPRAVYAQHQDRMSLIAMVKGSYTVPVMKGITLRGRAKYILDYDRRNRYGNTSTPDQYFDPAADDYVGNLVWLRGGVEWPVTDNLSVGGGNEFAVWFEKNRSGAVVGGSPDFADYTTFKDKLWVEARYVLGAANLWYRIEYLNKDLLACGDANFLASLAGAQLCTDREQKRRLDQHLHHVLRSIATVSASF